MATKAVKMSDEWHNFDEYRFGPREDYTKMDYKKVGLRSPEFTVENS
jgi:hypothetical protein